jgi:hypothetical protein
MKSLPFWRIPCAILNSSAIECDFHPKGVADNKFRILKANAVTVFINFSSASKPSLIT